jgi:hypothetical protein
MHLDGSDGKKLKWTEVIILKVDFAMKAFWCMFMYLLFCYCFCIICMFVITSFKNSILDQATNKNNIVILFSHSTLDDDVILILKIALLIVDWYLMTDDDWWEVRREEKEEIPNRYILRTTYVGRYWPHIKIVSHLRLNLFTQSNNYYFLLIIIFLVHSSFIGQIQNNQVVMHRRRN